MCEPDEVCVRPRRTAFRLLVCRGLELAYARKVACRAQLSERRSRQDAGCRQALVQVRQVCHPDVAETAKAVHRGEAHLRDVERHLPQGGILVVHRAAADIVPGLGPAGMVGAGLEFQADLAAAGSLDLNRRGWRQPVAVQRAAALAGRPAVQLVVGAEAHRDAVPWAVLVSEL